MVKVRIIGAGRAGRSFESALRAVGVETELVAGRGPLSSLHEAAVGVDAVLLAVPDRHVRRVVRAMAPVVGTVVLHCSGSLGLDVLGGHEHTASLHPLTTLPDPVIGAMRLQGGTFFAVAGDQMATDLALALGGQPIVVPDDRRAAYHAAASIASNHVVALLGQVERIAATAGLPLEAYLALTRGALDDVSMLGTTAALTGPASRGDEVTIQSHRSALDPSELPGYDAGVGLAKRLAGKTAAVAEVGGTGRWS